MLGPFLWGARATVAADGDGWQLWRANSSIRSACAAKYQGGSGGRRGRANLAKKDGNRLE